jgi:sulfonate transport system substrate-binding protein
VLPALLRPRAPADIQTEQTLSDAFFRAGQISKHVDFSQITKNVLPPGYNSLQLPGL